MDLWLFRYSVDNHRESSAEGTKECFDWFTHEMEHGKMISRGKKSAFWRCVLIITGVFMLLFSIYLKGIACFLCSVGILIVSLPLDIYYTYRVAKKYGDCK